MEPTKGNILLVANYQSNLGYAWWLMENFWVQVSRYAQQSNRECFLCFPEINDIPSAIASARIKVVQCDYADRTRTGRMQFLRLVRQNNIKSIYFTDKPYFDPYYAWLRMCGIRNIIVHDHTPGDRPPVTGFKGVFKLIRNSASPLCANYVFCVSEHMRERNIANARISASRCITVQNGIYPLKCTVDDRQYAHSQFGIPADAIVVVSTGRASPYKGIDFIIECANKAIREHGLENLYFIYCGGGPDLNNLKERAEHYQLNERFIFAGARNDVRRLLCSCAIGFHASAGEGLSLSILEYMSAGLAVMVPDIPSVRQSIVNNVTGCVYRSRNIHDATSLLARLVRDPTLRKAVGLRARKCIDDNYNINSCNERFQEIIKHVL